MMDVHLGFKGRRDLASGRAYTLGEEPPVPLVCPLDTRAIRETIDWMAVDKSARWQPVGSRTYCNVYASDVVHVLGGYLPRVWWIHPGAGNYTVAYGETVREMTANSLHDWMHDHGEGFGWQIVPVGADGSWMQDLVDESSTYGVIIGRNRDKRRPGHVTVVLPSACSGVAGDGPLQSQAGTTNKRWFRDRWWESSRFGSVVAAVMVPAGQGGARWSQG